MALWVEKYRPSSVADIILPPTIRNTALGIVEKNDLPHMIFNGRPGSGKTTLARALAHDLNMDVLFVNGAKDRNIDTLRGQLTQFASTMSSLGKSSVKCIILDEADGLNPLTTQPALRAFMEEYADNCRLILTCNQKTKIIDAIHSRCVTLEFDPSPQEIEKLQASFFLRATEILKEEGVEFDQAAVARLIQKTAPDWRKTLNILQGYSRGGSVDSGVLLNTADGAIDELITHLKEKNFGRVRKWVGENSSLDPNSLFRALYDSLPSSLDNQSLPMAILILADYQYKAAHVVDQEINTTACLIEIMRDCKWQN